MSAPAQAVAAPRPAAPGGGHRLRVMLLAFALGGALLAGIAYGWDYYLLPGVERPLSPKHALLKPSGTVGIKLGIAGFFCFVCIFLYPLRKRIKWLARRGVTRHWLDFHIVLGLSAPVIIALHSSLKFQGIAGMAFWSMLAVVVSGIIGRYIYAQIPRSLNAVELSLQDAASQLEELAAQLSTQELFTASDLAEAMHLPAVAEVERVSSLAALTWMLRLDLQRPFVMAQLRRRRLSGWQRASTLGGLLASSNPRIEQVIRTVRKRASLAKRALFLKRTHQVFQLWHVVHRPFSYSFVVLAALHIMVAMFFGFM